VTVENRRFIGLDAIIAIQYRCSNCKTTVTVPRDKWGDPPSSCPNPNCRTENNMPSSLVRRDSPAAESAIELQKIIRFLSDPKALPCEIHLELKRDDQ
jgi:DNA replicative helicase MCM subunit Mcm2 (Cdc46/Mcm family)